MTDGSITEAGESLENAENGEAHEAHEAQGHEADPEGAQPLEPRVTAPPRPFDDESPADEAAAPLEAADEDTDDDPSEQEPEVVAVAADPDTAEPFEDLDELPSLIEALLFVADHPVDTNYLSRAIELSVPRVDGALDTLAETLRTSQRGIRLQRGPAGVQLVSAPEASAHVERFLGLEANRRLSTAALETLAIIAYRQPITRGQVDGVRGVSSDGAIATLRARDLIEPAGHAPGPGRPMLFRTTQRFLEHFGLERPGQLPPLPEDIDLLPSEIGEQLGLDDATVAEALRPREPEPEAADKSSETSAELDAGSDADDEIIGAIAATADLDIPADVQALSEAAEHAFEASRDRLQAGPAAAAAGDDDDDEGVAEQD